MVSKVQVLLLMLASFVAACDKPQSREETSTSKPEFSGSVACATCHQTEFDLWQNSHHRLAMQIATTDTVLGDFSDVVLEYADSNTLFFKKDGDFIVRTENTDSVQQEFTVTHTFGAVPLQQYLVDTPGGRKQALPFAWDTRALESGGQRWYHLYPDEHVTADDPLHWTGRYFNWNYMCAECHSTDVQIAYDMDSDAFRTSFKEISVGCEACHGPGSLHVQQADARKFDVSLGLAVDLDDLGDATWIMNLQTGIAERSTPAAVQQQPESCGRCHARRSVIASEYEYGKPLTDTHMPSFLEDNLYYADGRIQDEVYVYGSFVQSKMYAAGVTCSDCHDAHSGLLHEEPNPSDICAQCHLPTRFATREHSGTPSSDCVECHMPATNYMGIDARRDHSFRIPGAGLRDTHYGPAIAAGRTGGANKELVTALSATDHPAIARATLLALLSPSTGEDVASVIQEGLEDRDPLVRIAALRALRHQDANLRMRFGSDLLRDHIRGVRLEAALTYVRFRDLLPLENARAFVRAADEYRDAMLAAASMPDAMANLAEFESALGNSAAAERHYEHAIRIDPDFAAVRHAYGLFLVRGGRGDIALQHLRSAATLAPDISRYVYVLGVAQNSLKRTHAAIATLTSARARFPNDFDIAWALATMLRDSGDLAGAGSVATAMKKQFRDSAEIDALLGELDLGVDTP